jgi:hypothetical protein
MRSLSACIAVAAAMSACSQGGTGAPSSTGGATSTGGGRGGAAGANGPHTGGAAGNGSGGMAAGGASGGGGTAITSSATGGRTQGQGGAQGGSVDAASGGATSTGGLAGGAGGVAAGGAGGGAGTGGSRGSGGSGSGGAVNCTPPNPPPAKDSVTLDMGSAEGAPTYRASGLLYGISEDASQPPTHMLTDIKTKFFRIGGSDVGCGGYVTGNYAKRWATVKAYYQKAKEIGATVIILVSDLWGEDPACATPRFPGDGGDWSDYTKFMTQLIADAQAAGMTGPDVRWDLQNEPDVPLFWNASRAQWLELWKRGYQMVRTAIPNAVMEGPSNASGVGSGWFTDFLDYVKANNVVPDVISWHGGDQVTYAGIVKSELTSRGINVSHFDNNEYGDTKEQNPGHSAWYIARIERANVDALRSNWGGPGGGGPTMYQSMADLTTLDWQPNSQWWIYKRYADQTGLRTSSTAGTNVDAVGYQDADKAQAIIVVGNNGSTTGSVNVVIKNVPSWLQTAGSTKVLLEKMPTGEAAVAAPTVVSNAAATVNCNALTVTIDWAKATDGYVVTLTP